MLYKYRYLFYAAAAILILSAGTLLFTLLSGSDPAADFDEKKKELNGIFSTYNGKVYALVPSNGYYEVSGARPETFRVLSGAYRDSHIGYDGRYVYAGNLILKGLRPDRTAALGNNYYTDGTTTWYCSGISEADESLGALAYTVQFIGYRWGLNAKPQSYRYPSVELPKDGKYQPRLSQDIAVSSRQAFYKGLPMPEADPGPLRPLIIQYRERSERPGVDYFTDGKRVYYHHQRLPTAYSPDLYELGIEGDLPSRNTYLVDQRSGRVYVDGQSFDPSKAPYRLLGRSLIHSAHVLFTAKDGMYFYNAENKETERAGDPPFGQQPVEEIAPDVFRSGDQIYYLSVSESWGRKTGLQNRRTHLQKLDGVRASELRKLPGGNSGYGSVWQSDHRYFYFDALGSSQLMPSAVYELKDASVARQLTASADLRSDDLRDLLDSGALKEAGSTTVVTATTDYREYGNLAYWLIGGGIVLVLMLTLVLKKGNGDPFVLKDGYLIINNFSFKKYRIHEIAKVVFTIERTLTGAGGYNGRMQVIEKSGKTGRKLMFAGKATLLPGSDAEMRQYIQKLQAQLRTQGIRSEIAG